MEMPKCVSCKSHFAASKISKTEFCLECRLDIIKKKLKKTLNPAHTPKFKGLPSDKSILQNLEIDFNHIKFKPHPLLGIPTSSIDLEQGDIFSESLAQYNELLKTSLPFALPAQLPSYYGDPSTVVGSATKFCPMCSNCSAYIRHDLGNIGAAGLCLSCALAMIQKNEGFFQSRTMPSGMELECFVVGCKNESTGIRIERFETEGLICKRYIRTCTEHFALSFHSLSAKRLPDPFEEIDSGQPSNALEFNRKVEA